MPDTKPITLRSVLVLTGVAVLTAAVGFVTTAQLSARADAVASQDPAVQADRRGPGMMGRGMMGPGGPGFRGGPGGPFGMGAFALRGLDLTDAQRDQVKAIMESHRDEQRAIGDRMQAARKALHEAIAADSFDEAAIRAKAADIGAVEADAAVLQAKIKSEVVAILTPEQLKKAKELRSDMENRMKEGRGRGMRPHQGPHPRPEPRAEGDINLPEAV